MPLAFTPSLSKFYPSFIQESKMAQFIRTPIDDDDIQYVLQHSSQVSQVSYRDERVIEIDWDYQSHRTVVQDNGQWFHFTSPDIDNLTIQQVITGLGYTNEQAVVTWADYDMNDVLNSVVENAPLNQITLYAPNQSIPAVHYEGALPAVAGQLIVNINNNNDELEFGPFQNAPENNPTRFD